MEPSPLAGYAADGSEESVIAGSGSGIGSISASMEGGVVGISPTMLAAESEAAEQNQVIFHEVIDVDKDVNAEDVIFKEKSTPNSKGKISLPSYLSDVDVAPTDTVYSSNGVSPISHNFTIGDESSHDMNFSDDDMIMNDDEFAMLQAQFDSFDLSPGVEAPIPWWPSSEGSKSHVPTSSSAFVTPSSFTNGGASKIDESESWTYTGTSQTDVHGSKSIWQPFPVSFSGEKPYNEPWQISSHSHFQQKLATWAGHGVVPSGTITPSASDADAGSKLPPGNLGTPYLHKSKNIKVLQSSGTKNLFTGWKIQGTTDKLTFSAGDLTEQNFTGGLMGGFSYMHDPLVMLEQGIAAEISVPSELASSDQDNGELLIVKRLESFKKFDTVQDHSDHHYSSKNQPHPSKECVKKIQEEWRILENDLPDTIFARVYETRMDLLRAVIIGADGTPYHDGIFFFDFHFPPSYPNVPPLVHYRSGGLRLNPNLYNSGKVCLSLLNTWGGDPNEKWVPGLSTMLQVLVSIQGLILNTEPYFNEPGYESMAGTDEGEKWSREYSENAFLLSLKTMLYSMRQPPKHFEDLVFGHFYKRAHDILAACTAYLDGAQVGTLVKGVAQYADEGDKKPCSRAFKTHLPVYINSLVKAFTKIGVSDCEKYTVQVNENENTVPEKMNSSSSSVVTEELKPVEEFDDVDEESLN